MYCIQHPYSWVEELYFTQYVVQYTHFYTDKKVFNKYKWNQSLILIVEYTYCIGNINNSQDSFSIKYLTT